MRNEETKTKDFRQNLDEIDTDALLAAKPHEVSVRRVPLGRPRSVRLFDLE